MVSYSLLSVWTSRHLLLGFESHVDDGASGEEWGMDLGLEREGKNQGHEFDHSIFFFYYSFISFTLCHQIRLQRDLFRIMQNQWLSPKHAKTK